LRININLKIALIFCVIIAVVLVGIFAYLDSSLRSYIYKRIRAALIKETLLARMFLEKEFPGYPEYKTIDKIADEAGKTLEARVTIIRLDGKVFGDSDLDGMNLANMENHLYRKEVQQALKSGIGESVRFSTTVKKRMLYVASVFGRDKPQGVVRLALALSDIEEISNYLKKTLFISLLIAFGIAVVASITASGLISGPIRDLAVKAREIAGGQFSEKILINSNDELSDLAAAFNNMSEEIKTKIEEITSNQTRLEAVFSSMFDGIMVVDPRGSILLINRALIDILNVQTDPVSKKPIEVLRNIEIQEITDKVLNLREGVESREMTLLLPGKKIFMIHGTPIVRDNNIEGAVLVFHDITEIRHLATVRRDFVANVSHELRTPATNIKGYTETLLDGALDDKNTATEFIQIIQGDADRLVNLISDLLDLSKLESGRISPGKRPCSIFNISQKVIDELVKFAQVKDIEIINNIADNLPIVNIDENMITQVFFNLIDNAIKYTTKAGKIIISSESGKDHLKIHVKDSGIGIPEKEIPRIFERFYCVDRARSKVVGGTGLGLSIVKHIIEEHGGTISVQSVLGRGSTFSFEIPLM